MQNSEKGVAPYIALVVVAVLLLGIGVFAYRKNQVKYHQTNTNTTSTTTTIETSPSPIPSSTMQENALSKGETNADLDSDLNNIGTKMNSLNQENGAVNVSLQDQSDNPSGL